MSNSQNFSRIFCVGLFVITLATMMYELLLTRIFSVTLWYHFAFMAVSLAMFGLTAGAMAVYLFAKKFPPERTSQACSIYSALFSLGIICTFWLQISIPLAIQFSSGWAIASTYVVLAVPFFFGGVVVCLALTRAKELIGRLYAWDLAGAALGCIGLITLLELVDGPTAVAWVSQLALVGAVLFSWDAFKENATSVNAGSVNADSNSPNTWLSSPVSKLLLCWLVALTLLAAFNPATHWVKLTYAKRDESVRPLFEKWNSFSRIRVYGDPNIAQAPLGWGLSSALPADIKYHQLILDIDSGAGTFLTRFNGDLSTVDALKYDITNIVHSIRKNADVMIIGAGAGRDILAALLFGQKSIVAAEINPNIIRAVTDTFGEFTGHLDRNPKVQLKNEEGRSFLSHTDKKFDIIQMSLVDTFAATSAGAFTLTENSLYTKEAWALMFSRLTPDGLISATRWYTAQKPGEIYRLTALAVQTLRDAGIQDVRKHIVLIRLNRVPDAANPNASGVGSLLLSKRAFTDEELNQLQAQCQKLKFEMVVSARGCEDTTLAQLTSPAYETAIRNSPLLIGPPTDDSPYFFQMVRLKDWARLDMLDHDPMVAYYALALMNLAILTILVTVLAVAFIFGPLLLRRFRQVALDGAPLGLYFSAIGFGFILIEMSIIQKFQLFLGIPIYSLAVTLFTLLTCSAAGSFLSQLIETKRPGSAKWLLVLLLILSGVFALCEYPITQSLAGLPMLAKIAVTVCMVAPLGTLMGMPLPLGMQFADQQADELKPWLWACNGAMSVFGSVIAVIISLSLGVSATFLFGLGSYCIAFACFLFIARKKAFA